MSLTDTPEVQAKLARLAELKKEKQRRYLAKLAVARRDFRHFTEFTLRDESSGEPIKLAPIQLQWIEHIHFAWSQGLHAAILAPWGHGKTTIFGVAVPLFAFGQDSKLRILMLSHNDKKAKERVTLVRKYIDHSREYQELFPTVKPDEEMGWTKGEIYLAKPDTMAKDPNYSAFGINSSAMGSRVDILIADDVNDPKNTLFQPKKREEVWEAYRNTFTNRLEPGGKSVVIMTRWHEKDLAGHILDDPEIRTRYAFLIQRVSENFDCIESETIVPKDAQTGHVAHRLELSRLFHLAEEGLI